ncbi:MAG: hypothetical protein JW837_18235 [Sedimentisphaerales bacterium]|nr:hypothetical protein [Sedimentisphaerales bacterium]
MNLLKNCLIKEVAAPVAAAPDTDQNSDILDMQCYDGVCFIVPVTDSVATGVAKLTVEQSGENSDSGMAALSGAEAAGACAVNDDLNDKLLIVDVYRPRERFVQGVITSETANIAFGNMIAVQYNGSKCPIIADPSVIQAISAFGPAEA